MKTINFKPTAISNDTVKRNSQAHAQATQLKHNNAARALDRNALYSNMSLYAALSLYR